MNLENECIWSSKIISQPKKKQKNVRHLSAGIDLRPSLWTQQELMYNSISESSLLGESTLEELVAAADRQP